MNSLEIDYMNAISRGHYQKVIYFIQNGININTKDKNGETGILKAMKNGYKEIVKYLLQNGVDIKNDSNLIFEAAKKGYLDIVISLLKYEASPKIRREALDIAQKVLNQKKLTKGISEQNIYKVINAVENGADVNKRDILSWSPLMNSTLKGNQEITKYLIDNGAKINYKNKNNSTALSKAVETGELFIVELLLKNGANPNIKDKSQNTPLILAVKHGDLDIIKILLKYNANLNVLNDNNETPINIAIKNNFIDIVEYFIKKGTKLNNFLELAYNNKHYYLVDKLIKYENNYAKRIHFIRLLENLSTKKRLEIQIRKNNLKKIKDILKNNKCDDLNSLLFMSVKLSRNDIINYLILSGANPNTYFNNLSPIMISISRGDFDIVKTLISCGADVNGKGNFILGYPLTIAINEGHFEITKLLVENGANINKSYGFKLSATEEAKISKNNNIINYFKNIK